MAATIDRPVFEELKTTAGADFVHELVDTFLTEAPRMLAELRRALDANEADRFRRVAHSLKSNSNTFGASALAAMAKNLELGGFAAARSAMCFSVTRCFHGVRSPTISATACRSLACRMRRSKSALPPASPRLV